MSTAFIITIISSLILLALGLSLKIANLSHRLSLIEKEYNSLKEKQSKYDDENNGDVFSSGVHFR